MIQGPIIRTILSLAVPIMASSFLGTLYNICDMAWVGTLGAKVVAGVGVGGMFTWLASGFALLPKIGGQVLTAQSIGAGDMDKAKNYTRAAIQLVIAFGVIFGSICVLFTQQLVGFFHLQDVESVSSALKYIRVTCGLTVFTFLNMTLTGLYTADGDSKTPMVANLFGLALNMILDPLLITGVWIFPRLEALGAAIATVFSQLVVLVILILRTRHGRGRTDIFRSQNFKAVCAKSDYVRIARIGAPIAMQSVVYCFISMVLTRFVSAFGAEAVAVARVGGQIESVSWNTADGFSSALNAFCGQNYGAEKYDRIRKGYVFSVFTSFMWGMVVTLCFTLLPRQISSVFFHEQLAIDIFISYLVVIGLSEPFLMAELVTQGALSGLGRTRLCGILSVLLTALRIPMAFLIRRIGAGLVGIWWVVAATTMLKGIVFTAVFLRMDPSKGSKV